MTERREGVRRGGGGAKYIISCERIFLRTEQGVVELL